MEEIAPGVRFYPTEEELVSFYLHHKLEGERQNLNQVMDRIIPVLDIYQFSPSQLPQLSGEYNRNDPEQWFFFIPRQESEVRGGRPKRLTAWGYWKATGSPGCVYSSNNRCIGVKRTMVFYTGRAPNGNKTEWKINEYKALQPHASSSSLTPPQMQSYFSINNLNCQLRQEYSVCRVYKKSKCIRAFDRRPVGMQIKQLSVKEGDGGERETSHEFPTVQIRSSSDNQRSYLGDDPNGEGSNMVMATDGDQHILDFDQLTDNWSIMSWEDM